MNSVFIEGDLRFDFSKSRKAFVADKPEYAGLSAVDFIVENENEWLFIEVKDPDNPKAKKECRDRFLAEMKDAETCKNIFGKKLKDSLLRQLARGECFSKPVKYVVVLECTEFDALLRLKLFEDVNSALPKFNEDEYAAIKRVEFHRICNIDDFMEDYSMFEVKRII
ncbi:MAG: hypothetical protein FWD25_12450 [Clostridia bacterium]|nr:hypothetical protein [Clostridia bacterium]